MAKRKALKKTEIRAALSELDELCKAEYEGIVGHPIIFLSSFNLLTRIHRAL
jgi:hypothetical protein